MKTGINQSDRLPHALDPTFVVPDERTLLELVKFTLSYSESVTYYDFHNKPLGNWKPFLLNDPVFIAGLIAATSLESYKIRQDDLEVRSLSKGKFPKDLQEAMAENLLGMIKNLVNWEEFFADCNYTGPLVKEIVNSKRFLDPIIGEVFHFQKRFKTFEFPGLKQPEKSNNEDVNFSEYFKTAYKNLVYIVEFAAKRFDELINEESGNHQPHIGLLLAALKLFTEVQEDLNTLTKRHLDFYYQRILQQFPPQASPLKLLIGLLPKPEAEVLPENSDFLLVFPSKKVLPFKNHFFAELSQARIAELRSLYISDYYPFSNGFNRKKIGLKSIYDSNLFKGEEKNELSFKGESQFDFPLLMGEDQSQKGLDQQTMKTSLLGLVVSSPVFLVENGKQFFKIIFELSQKSCHEFVALMTHLFEDKVAGMGLMNTYSKNELKSFIHTFLNESFSAAITGQKGWQTLDFLHISFIEAEFKLVIKLEPEGPLELPVSFDSELHGGIADANWPCIRFLFNNAAHLPPYKLLQVLEILEVEIRTLSKGVTSGFECSNQVGKLDSSNPFLPFGSIPTKDSHFKIANPLIFNKYLSRISFKLSWLGIPEERTGFIGYYAAYPEKITNQSFKANISIKSALADLEDSAEIIEQKVDLFDTVVKSDGDYLLKSKSVDLNMNLIDMTVLTEPRLKISDSEERIFLDLQLAEPSPFVFGHLQYAQLYSDTSFYNSRYPKRQKELPKIPYTPSIEKIEFTYSNQTKENLQRSDDENSHSIKIFHLYPFGFTQAFPASGNGSFFLVPQLTGKGNLLIGLTSVKQNEFLNLGFKLHPAFFIHTITHPPKVAWEYLEKNKWIPLGNLLMEDSTNGMLQSGIVKIKLPSKLDFNNTRISAGKFWLRVSNLGNRDINSRLISVFTNATWITQVTADASSELLHPEELRENLSVASMGNLMLDGVIGPYHIKVPKFKKSSDQDRVRVSESTRHRKRGISTWDLERIVLDHFPQIGRVMVYGRSDYPLHLVKNSNIQVVVIPRSPLISQVKQEGFRAPFDLLQEIKSYLQGFISPFSRLEVCNPVFERLKIRGAVKFKNTQQSGYYRDLLERELIKYLSPNPGDFEKEKGFINSIYKAEIQNHIESLPYVDFITGLSILQIVEVQGQYKIIDTAEEKFKVELLRTISPYAILTSAESHQLDIIFENGLQDPEVASIGDLSIESDFIIKQNKR